MKTKLTLLFALTVVAPACFGQNGDTLIIDQICAVLFHPDSLRLEKLKSENNEEDFYTIADDNLYYIAGAREYLENRSITTIDTKKRFIKFIKTNGEYILVNLDALEYPWGVYLFDGKQNPLEGSIVEIQEDYALYFDR